MRNNYKLSLGGYVGHSYIYIMFILSIKWKKNGLDEPTLTPIKNIRPIELIKKHWLQLKTPVPSH